MALPTRSPVGKNFISPFAPIKEIDLSDSFATSWATFAPGSPGKSHNHFQIPTNTNFQVFAIDILLPSPNLGEELG
ncbi:hypothetical protein NIES593_02440 [Hydrococcus rivularis NIES-593]|uniref:Uncharacterized protein n=1 Tax=Hydrococcus rivularis NIES-593 TaxID=1921803 RepID=A0A1U7HR01_9CYAN|nr:hypothetical protein [Hydrococcus rivularis]OKH25964.1 hypothetical protein NIES593_02440 [Hydrococcus rivularis NIES-593]